MEGSASVAIDPGEREISLGASLDVTGSAGGSVGGGIGFGIEWTIPDNDNGFATTVDIPLGAIPITLREKIVAQVIHMETLSAVALSETGISVWTQTTITAFEHVVRGALEANVKGDLVLTFPWAGGFGLELEAGLEFGESKNIPVAIQGFATLKKWKY